MVTVLIENGYECGRESTSTVEIKGPGEDMESWWEDVRELTGDGHSCGSSENALYEAKIIAASGRPDLVGETMEWGG